MVTIEQSIYRQKSARPKRFFLKRLGREIHNKLVLFYFIYRCPV